jgi:hypothetical protein
MEISLLQEALGESTATALRLEGAYFVNQEATSQTLLEDLDGVKEFSARIPPGLLRGQLRRFVNCLDSYCRPASYDTGYTNVWKGRTYQNLPGNQEHETTHCQ